MKAYVLIETHESARKRVFEHLKKLPNFYDVVTVDDGPCDIIAQYSGDRQLGPVIDIFREMIRKVPGIKIVHFQQIGVTGIPDRAK